MKIRLKNNSGTAMLYVLGLLMVLSMGLTGSWRYLISTMDQSAHNRHVDAARHYAESGAYAAMDELSRDANLAEIPLTAFSGGAYAVEIEDRGGNRVLHATGYLGETAPYMAEYKLQVTLGTNGRALRWEKERAQ